MTGRTAAIVAVLVPWVVACGGTAGSVPRAGEGEDAGSSPDAHVAPRSAPSDAGHRADRAVDDASPEDATGPDATGAVTAQLDIPPRNQWNDANGYCGEMSIQSIALYYGTWASENVVREVAGGELLIGVNGPKALKALHLDYVEWDNSVASPQYESFMLWMKSYLLKGAPSFFGAYLTDGNDDPDYDHIMPLTGVATNHPGAYDDADMFTWNDNFGDQILRAASEIGATRASCAYSSTQGGCIPIDVDYGIAVTGVVDPKHVTLPTRLAVAKDSEPNVSLGAQAAAMHGTITVSGLTVGTLYELLRYDHTKDVPTDASAKDYLTSSSTYRVSFVASAPTWTYADPHTFSSAGVTTYRCVAK